MKKLIIPIIIITAIFACNKNDKPKIIISAHVNDSLIEVVSLILADSTVIDTVVNDQFEFKLDVHPKKPINFVKLQLPNQLFLYVKPGDSIFVEATNNQIVLSGKGCEESKYLQLKLAKAKELGIANPHMIDIRTFSSGIDTFLLKIDSIRQIQTDLFTSFKEKNPSLDPVFIEKEQNLIAYQWMKQKLEYQEFHEMLTQNKVELPENYYDFTKNIDWNDSTLILFDEYKSCLNNLLKLKTSDTKNGSPENLKAKYVLCKKIITSKTIFQEIAYSFIRHHIIFNGVDDIDLVYNDFIKKLKNNNRKEHLIWQYKAWENMKQGLQAPEFELKDENSKVVKLSDFKGKYVYIDCWSTKCGKCIAEMPKMKQLVDELKNNNDIAFLTIASDPNETKWKDKLATFNINTINLCTREMFSKFNRDYNVKAMPRYILIGKDGEIIDALAPKPSEIKEKLINLLKS